MLKLVILKVLNSPKAVNKQIPEMIKKGERNIQVNPVSTWMLSTMAWAKLSFFWLQELSKLLEAIVLQFPYKELVRV